VLQDNADARADVDREPSAAAVTAYVSTCAWLAFAQADLGEFDSAETWADRARAEAEARRHPYSEAIALTLAGQVAALRAQLERAVAPLARALTICLETSPRWRPFRRRCSATVSWPSTASRTDCRCSRRACVCPTRSG
jgi:hypothetical protein